MWHVPSPPWRGVGGGREDEPMTDQSTTEAMHQAIAAFTAAYLAEHPDGFTGGFSYRVDIHRVDGGVEPFIYTTDNEHTELWHVG